MVFHTDLIRCERIHYESNPPVHTCCTAGIGTSHAVRLPLLAASRAPGSAATSAAPASGALSMPRPPDEPLSDLKDQRTIRLPRGTAAASQPNQKEQLMNTIILACLLMLCNLSLSYAAADCTVVQYPDHSEVMCVGESTIRLVSDGSRGAAAITGVPSSSAQIAGDVIYATVQEAYDVANNGDVIKISGETIPGPLLANNPLLDAVTFEGGYDSSFVRIAGNSTTILGTVTVQQGRVNMDGIKVRSGIGSLRQPVNLGTAGNFVILAKSAVSTTGTSAVVGDIGVSPAAASFITGFALIADPSNVFSTSADPPVSGKLYAADYAAPTPANMTTAISDMETAFSDAAGRTLPDFTELGAGDISGMTLVPGLYKWGTGLLVTNAGVTLSGGANDVWIFQIAQDLTVNNSAIVTLSGGAQAKNIFWQVAGQATLGTAADFKGIILSQTLISFNSGAQLTGRALAQTAVTLNATAVTAP